MTAFSGRLKELRKDRGLTQKSLGEKVGMSEGSMQAYELELRRPTADALIALSKFFDVSIDYLLGETDNPKRF